jgi:hypothetical protein
MDELPPRPHQICAHCDGPTKLALNIDRLGAKPGTQVFQCQDCARMTWVALEAKSTLI